MSLFQCENCGCCENTALTTTATKYAPEWFDWSAIEDRDGKLLCSVCAPTKYSDGSKTKYGVWHGEFDRVMLPMGEFKTNDDGNLEHIETGSVNFMDFELK